MLETKLRNPNLTVHTARWITMAVGVFSFSVGWGPVLADGVSTPEEVQKDCMHALTPDETIRVSVEDKARCIQAIENAMAARGGKKKASSPPKLSLPFVSSLLLKPRTTELGLGFIYSQNVSRSNLRTDRSRDMSIPLSVSLGLSRRLQSSFSFSLQNNSNEISTTGNVDSYKTSGSGDTTIGLIYQLSDGKSGLPTISFSMNYGIPTGKPSDPRITGSTGTGSGYRYGSLGLSVVKDSDPAVLFSNVAYRYVFERQEEGYTVQPGPTLSYGFGAGFSINNKLTLSGSFSGSIQSEISFDGEPFAGTSREPISFRTGLTYQTTRTKRLEGSLDYGLNEDASGVSVDLMYLFSF